MPPVGRDRSLSTGDLLQLTADSVGMGTLWIEFIGYIHGDRITNLSLSACLWFAPVGAKLCLRPWQYRRG